MPIDYLVLIETSANQAFIFATNKLRENVGASHLTHAAGTEFVRPSLQSHHIQDADVLVSTSSKALFLAPSEGVAKEIIKEITTKALREAPGLELRGAFVRCDLAKPASLHEAVQCVHERHAELASFLPGPRERFLRLPVVADCATSGLPAMKMDKDGPQPSIPISKVTAVKRMAAVEGWKRIHEVLADVEDEDQHRFRLAHGPDHLDSLDLNWLAVIHADGNGFGKIFLNFQNHLPGGPTAYDNRQYITKLREFSDGLDQCTLGAFRAALGRMANSWSKNNPERTKYLPVVPLVLGGDDLTVLCDGRYAVQLARDFLEKFENKAQELAERVLTGDIPSLGACAGIAIVKPHYPFYAAYDLAEELLKSAKKSKPNSALDFHILYDASASKLKTIREKLRSSNTTLTARPYIVTPQAMAPEWKKIKNLSERVQYLRPQADGQRALPRGMLHDLREGLFLGRKAAEARLQLARGRHGNDLHPLLTPDDTLFVEDNGDYVTGFLDALDLVEFWETEEQP